MSSHSLPFSKSSRGFGLIELMVSVSIMMLVAGIILIRQNSFNGSVLLESQAYEIAFSLREVQQNAVSATVSGTSNRDMLGVYFDTDENRNTTYRIYRDNESDGSYEAAEEYGQQNSLDGRFEIKAIRVGGEAKDTVSVLFKRPNFDAIFYVGATRYASAASVEIDIGAKDATSGYRTVIVSSTGQITVQ